MTTLRDLQYVLEANTKGLSDALPVLEKMVNRLEAVATASTQMAQRYEQQADRVATATRAASGENDRAAQRMETAMARQAAAANNALHRVQALNDAMRRKMGSTAEIDRNIQAMVRFTRTMQSGQLSASEYRRALTELNNVLSISKRSLAVFTAQEREANDSARAATAILKSQEAARRSAESSIKKEESTLLKQENALARVRQRYLDLQNALENVKASPARMTQLNDAFSGFEQKMKGGTLSSTEYSKAINEVNEKFGNIRRSSNIANPALQNVITRMNDLTSSAQVALGPLSGVASRISAITTLAARASLVAAGVITVFIAFATALGKAVMEGAEFEQQMLRINAVLEATQNKAGLTTQEVLNIAGAVADTTMATQDASRDAAAALAANVKVTDQVFESALRAAQGLSLIGRGDVVSQIRRISRGLENPAENLKSLTEAGVYFTEVEARKIKTLQASGDLLGAQIEFMKKLKPLEKAAAAENEGLSGTWQNFVEAFNDFFETAALQSGLIPTITRFVKDFTEGLKHLASETGAAVALGKAFVAVMKVLFVVLRSIGVMIGSVIWLFEQLIGVFRKVSDSHILEWFVFVAKTLTGDFAGAAQVAIGSINRFKEALDKVDGTEVNATVKATDRYGKDLTWTSIFGQDQLKVNAAASRAADALQAAIVDVGLPLLSLEESIKDNNDQWKKWQSTIGRVGESTKAFLEKTLYLMPGSLNRITMILKTGLNTELGRFEQGMLKDIQVSADAAKAAGALGSAKGDLIEQQRIYNTLMSEGNFTHEEALRASLEGTAAGIATLTPAMQDFARIAIDAADKTRMFDDEAARLASIVNGRLNLNVAQQELALIGAGEVVRTRELAILQKRNEILLASRDVTAEELGLVAALADVQAEIAHQNTMKEYEDQLAIQEKQLHMFNLTSRGREDALAVLNKQVELEHRYGTLLDARAQKEMAAFEQTLALERQIEGMVAVLDAVETGFDNTFMAVFDWLSGAENGFESLKETAVKALKDIAAEILKTFVMTPVKNALFGALGGGVIGGLGGSGAVAQTGVIGTGFQAADNGFAGLFAKGGTIPRGKWGIVGENGPEAVFGGASGAGVRSNGSLAPVINIIEGPGVKATAKSNSDGGVDVFVKMIDERIAAYDKKMPRRVAQINRDPRSA